MRAGLVIVLAVVVVAGCGGDTSETTATTATTTQPGAEPTTSTSEAGGGVEPPTLAGTSWTVTDHATDGAITNVWPDTEVTVSFSDDGMVSGSTGCNEYSGPFVTEGLYDPFEEGTPDRADGQVITLGPLVVTERACEERIMEQEAEILGLLDRTGRWLIARGDLNLRTADGTFLLEAEPTG